MDSLVSYLCLLTVWHRLLLNTTWSCITTGGRMFVEFLCSVNLEI